MPTMNSEDTAVDTSVEDSILLSKLEKLGGNGRFLWWLFLVCTIPCILNGMNVTGYVYITEIPTYWCKVDGFDSEWTSDEIRKISSPAQGNISSCFMNDWDYNLFSNMSFNDTMVYLETKNRPPDVIKCDSFNYEPSVSSVVKSFDLVCDRASLKSFVQVAFSFGKFMGAFIFGILADKYGRRTTYLLSTICYITSGPTITFAGNYLILMVGRMLLGAAGAGIYQGAYVILSEFSSKKMRSTVTIIYNLGYPLGQILVSIVAYFVRDWQVLQLGITLPSVFIMVFYWSLPESPRWLLSKGRRTEAHGIVDRATKKYMGLDLRAPLPSVNGEEHRRRQSLLLSERHNNSNGIQIVETRQLQEKKKNFCDNLKSSVQQLIVLFKYKELRSRLLIVLLTWFVCSMSYYGLAINVDNIGTDRYVYGFMTGVVEAPSYILPLPLLKWFGRRKTSFLLISISGLSLLSIPFISKTDGSAILLIVISIGRLAISAVFAVIILHTSELFPTPVRNTAIGCSSTTSHIGSMSAPIIVDLLGSFGWSLPTTVWGIMALITSVFIILLPETENQPLPETIDEVRNANIENRTGLHQMLRAFSFAR